jgi:lactate permease
MFRQLLTPVADSLGLSFLVAALPIVAVLVLLGVLRRPAWQAALGGLSVALVIAVTAWQMPVGLAIDAAVNGAVFALWPVMWIVVNALLIYNIAVRSGRFDAFRNWVANHLPNDRRVVLVVIGFCFGALLEGVAGFGAPVAITSSLLILVGFPPLEAVVFSLIFNTAPVAFGALGTPVTVLGAVTGLPAPALGAMIGRQLPVIAIVLPFYVIALSSGWRSVRALWPVLLVAGGSFAIAQFVASNLLDYSLTDVISSLGSLIGTLAFLRIWRPAPDPEFAIASSPAANQSDAPSVPDWQGWLPWVVISAMVIFWTSFKLFAYGQQNIAWPGLHRAISITLYND